jgi:RsiW-degrading membrane proteinase PrsW (M82 family)
LGALGIIPATLLELFFQPSNPVLNAFIPTAIVEEFMKFAAVRAKAYDSPSFSEPMDGIIYGVTASLGFATVENIFYVMGFGAISTAIARAFLSVPSHAAYGGIMGYYLGLAKPFSTEQNEKRERQLIIIGLSIAILLHGIFDAIAFTTPGIIGLIGLLTVALISWLILTRLIKKAIQMPPRRGYTMQFLSNQDTPRYCTTCGARREVGAMFCINCGKSFHDEPLH